MRRARLDGGLVGCDGEPLFYGDGQLQKLQVDRCAAGELHRRGLAREARQVDSESHSESEGRRESQLRGSRQVEYSCSVKHGTHFGMPCFFSLCSLCSISATYP